MKTTINFLALTSLALVACGDNKTRPDAMTRRDSPPADAYCSNCPAAPTIGTTQIDRMGRPAINTALVKSFNDETPTTTPGATAKDAYNANSDISTWQSYLPEFAANLAILDVLDGALPTNGICEVGETNALNPTECPTAAQVGDRPFGCGNALQYNSTVTNMNPQAYGVLAGLLTNDQLWLDTSKMVCGLYLAVEFGAVTGGGNTTCGGRAPAYDVIDFTYSVVAAGVGGFTIGGGNFTPKYGDGVAAHTDLLTSFPYLGPPH